MSGPACERGRVLVFARAPVAGRSKTRLIPALGAEGAARLSARLLRRTLRTVSGFPVELWCTPSTDHPAFTQCAGEFAVSLHTQRGADLGERMLHGIEGALTRGPWVVVIGCDCPELTREDIAGAASALEDGADAVLGPAEDGGYYLIGLRRPMPGLFQGVDWGTDRVLAQTRDRLRRHGCRWHELATRRDLDRPGDLRWHPGLQDPETGPAPC